MLAQLLFQPYGIVCPSVGAALSGRETTALAQPGLVKHRFGPPGYGLGLMGTTPSLYGHLWGHNGSGPGFQASAFHAPAFLGGAVTVCVMCAVEDDDLAEGI